MVSCSVCVAIWASRSAASLRLGARARNQKPASAADEQHDDDDEAIASGHGVVVADAVWAPLGLVGVAKKRVIENCG